MGDPAEPLQEYQRRLADRQANLAQLDRWDTIIANLRLAVFVAAVVLAWLALVSHDIHPAWIMTPVVVFGALVIFHDRVRTNQLQMRTSIAYYERGIARLQDQWIGTGWDGADLAPNDHAYASDLDLFGRGSLFQLLSTAQTRAGGKTLAEWLLAPAAPDEIRSRQAAVEELRSRLDLREELASCGRDLETGVLPEAIAQWAADPEEFKSRKLVFAAYGASFATVLGGALAYYGAPSILLLMALVALANLHLMTRSRIHRVLAAADEPSRELEVVGQVMARLEREPFNSPYLQALQKNLGRGSKPASLKIARFRQLMRLQEASLNLLFAPVAAVLMWNYHFARALEQWRAGHAADIGRWLADVGRLEALSSIAAYAYEHPSDPFPTIEDTGPVFDGQGLGHPLLPTGTCVTNDIKLDTQLRLLIVSGSNMSGKSVLLRTVGLSAVLAAAGAPVRARSLRISPLSVGATMNVHDSLQAGVSRFYAEIKRLRALVDITRGPMPLLFLLDEIMHGTNSQDRRIGAQAIIRGLLNAGAIGMVTTHDLALTDLTGVFGESAANAHFEDHLEEGRLVFDYQLRPGVVTRSNALDLMRAVGLHVD